MNRLITNVRATQHDPAPMLPPKFKLPFCIRQGRQFALLNVHPEIGYRLACFLFPNQSPDILGVSRYRTHEGETDKYVDEFRSQILYFLLGLEHLVRSRISEI